MERLNESTLSVKDFGSLLTHFFEAAIISLPKKEIRQTIGNYAATLGNRSRSLGVQHVGLLL